jgi:hypothetical protein
VTLTRPKLLKALRAAADLLEDADDALALAVDQARSLVEKSAGRWSTEPGDSFYCGTCACTQFYVTRAEAGVSLQCAKCGKAYAVTVQASPVVTFPEGLES